MELSLFSFSSKRKSVFVAFSIILLSFLACNEQEDAATELLSGNDIVSFKTSKGDVEYAVTISGTNINIVSPFNEITANNLTLEIVLSEGASISPNPTTITTITNPVEFVVTAENGSQKTYTVTVSREQSPENNITAVLIENSVTNDKINADINVENNIISKEIPPTWSLTQVTIEMELPEFASIDPDPSTIDDYSEPVDFVVTAENGSEKNYRVELTRLLFENNDFESFTLKLQTIDLEANIDVENGIIAQRVSPNTNLSELSVEYSISAGATIVPDPSTVTDYTTPVSFMITSESNIEKTYNVVFEPMEALVNINCDQDNASKWFGGDNREDKVDPEYFFAPRNVGTGQSFTPEEDLFISSYSIRFSDYFQFVDDNGSIRTYFGNTTVRLQLRDAEGNILAVKDKTFDNPMQLFWQRFDLADLNLVLKKDSLYYFTWYLVDGETLGIVTGSYGNTDMLEGSCNGQGLSGTSTIREETSLDDWESWGLHPWHFNFRLEGLK